MTLAAFLADVADEDPGVAAAGGPAHTIEYRVGDRVIAVAHGDASAEFRLDPVVAAAARRTPDTDTSDRGPEWVRFSPAELDPHAADRARAWFEAAVRRARIG